MDQWCDHMPNKTSLPHKTWKTFQWIGVKISWNVEETVIIIIALGCNKEIEGRGSKKVILWDWSSKYSENMDVQQKSLRFVFGDFLRLWKFSVNKVYWFCWENRRLLDVSKSLMRYISPNPLITYVPLFPCLLILFQYKETWESNHLCLMW